MAVRRRNRAAPSVIGFFALDLYGRSLPVDVATGLSLRQMAGVIDCRIKLTAEGAEGVAAAWGEAGQERDRWSGRVEGRASIRCDVSMVAGELCWLSDPNGPGAC